MTCLLGIDLGSTTTKVFVYNLKGESLSDGCRPTPRSNPDPDHPDWVVWEPEALWNAVAEASKEAIGKLSNRHEIAGLAVTCFGMDGLPVDARGKELYPLISWHCPRTVPQFEWWKNQVGAQLQFRIGGNVIWPFNTALRLLWMRDHHPEIMEKTAKWLLVGDYLNYRLCGEMSVDYTMASTTLLFDQKEGNWSRQLLDRANLDSSLLCDPKPSGTLLGKVTPEASEATGIPKGTPVVLGGHDYLVGSLPVGGFKPGTIINNLGTWEIAQVATAELNLGQYNPNSGLTGERHAADGVFSVMGAAVGLDVFEWYRTRIGKNPNCDSLKDKNDSLDQIIKEAETVCDRPGKVFFLPHLSGSGCPVIDPHSKGAFVGLSNNCLPSHLTRAVIEGLNSQFKDIVLALDPDILKSNIEIRTIGGGTRNQFLMQNRADMLGIAVETPRIEEACALGAAIIAGLGVGVYHSVQEAFDQVYRPGRVFEPDFEKTGQYQDHFEIYKSLHNCLKPVHEALSQLA